MQLEFYPESKVLLQKAELIERFDSELDDIANEMFQLMRQHRGVGLAAPQIGLSRRLFVMNKYGIVRVVVNPLVIRYENKLITDVESCLSIPGYSGMVQRSASVLMVYYNLSGKRIEVVLNGLDARVVQHEEDHLNGWLFPHYTLAMKSEDYFIERDPRPTGIFTISDVTSLTYEYRNQSPVY